MEGSCCTSSSSSTDQNPKRKPRQHTQDKPYRGIRMRKWGKWVAEIREPNKRQNLARLLPPPSRRARAYDTAVFYLRGPSARLNFPECIVHDPQQHDLSAAAIRKKATEVGAMVDALQAAATPEATRVGSPMKNPI
ncbi:UNVERIFIED_CONTAM: Ethylene-responsive transcription factor [Sesamum radiatum]|uniref:Ethylene-responsive transcription factor n=1 Tax=Sesamum radiatum TaxID=300843 RepID=A0AAW2M3B6_SESRA